MIAGRYTRERELGRGGMGAVWLGTDTVLGRAVALKQLTPVAAGGPPAARAEREARLAARLSHPHVVAVFDLVDDEDGQPWLVMEYVEGTTLARLVSARGPLPLDDAAAYLSEAADGLRAAHAAGIVHRDVKPSNILLGADGHAKLTDFGVARGIDGESTLTQSGVVTGSPAYLSPEVAMGRPATPASDVWSFGATLFHAVEGKPPYDVGDNVLGTLYRIVHEQPPRAPHAGWLGPVIEGTMTQEPAHRWTIDQVHAYLSRQPIAATTGSASSVPPGPVSAPPTGPQPASPPTSPPTGQPLAIAPEPGAVRRRRSRALLPIAVGALVLVAVAVTLVTVLARHNGGQPDRVAAHGPSRSVSSSPSTPSAQPTATGIRSFVTTYLQTAPRDPAAGFAMLTPTFQSESGGLSGYEGFWGKVARIDSVRAITPKLGDDDLRVSYHYTYTMDNGSQHTEEVHLRLLYDGGRYLIDGD